MKKRIAIALMAGCFLLSLASCKRHMTTEQAKIHLKAFDSEMLNFSRQVSESCTFRFFEQLQYINQLPLPLRYNTHNKSNNTIAYCFNKHKGIYTYNLLTNNMEKTAHSDSVILVFPFECNNQPSITFILADYSEQYCAWGVMFPVKMNVKLYAGNTEIMSLQSQSKLKHSFPVESFTEISFENFDFILFMNTRLSNRKTRANINFRANKNKTPIMKVGTKLHISANNDNSMNIEKLRYRFDMFPIISKGHINYGNIPANTHRFSDQFNKNSKIEILNYQNTHAGTIELRERANHDKLNFVVQYSDSSYSYLDDLLISFRKVLNFKI